jgi:hypothetical protein
MKEWSVLVQKPAVSVFSICHSGGWVSRRKMEKLKMTVHTMKGGYVGFRKAQLEPLLATLLEDPLLADVSKKEPTLQELETLIGVEKGSAMMLCIRKMDGTSFGTVPHLPPQILAFVERLKWNRIPI